MSFTDYADMPLLQNLSDETVLRQMSERRVSSHHASAVDKLSSSVATHQTASKSQLNETSRVVSKAAGLLEASGSRRGITAWRKLRAEVSLSERRCDALRARLAEVEAEVATGEARSMTELILSAAVLPDKTARLETLTEAKQRDETHEMEEQILDVRTKTVTVERRLIHARSVLVREAIGVFDLKQKSGLWRIAGKPLPSPEDFRRESPLDLDSSS